MLSYSSTWQEFYETVIEKYESISLIQYSSIRELDNVWVASQYRLRASYGIAFTGHFGKSIHGPTLAVAFALTCDDYLLHDLLWAWTEMTDDDGFIIAFPSIEVDKFNSE